MGYTQKDTINQLHESLKKADQLYNSDCINWTGKTLGANKEYYSEVIAAELLQQHRMDLLKGIEAIGRSDYFVRSHELNMKRREELFAKSLFLFELEVLGKVIDYQIPLKNKRSDKAGKIDLVTIKNDIAYIVELKYAGNKETLLRAVLEIVTYYQLLNKNKFMEFLECKGLRCKRIKKAVLLSEDSNAHKEIQDLANRPKLNELIKNLDVEIILLRHKIKRISL